MHNNTNGFHSVVFRLLAFLLFLVDLLPSTLFHPLQTQAYSPLLLLIIQAVMACRVLLLRHAHTPTHTPSHTNAAHSLPQFDFILPCCDLPLHQISFTSTFFWLVQAYLSICLTDPIMRPQSCKLTPSSTWTTCTHTLWDLRPAGGV